MRRIIVGLLLATLASVLVLALMPAASSTPVATSDAEYTAYGRIFPDPHGCHVGEPGFSPWAKGRVCAVDFIQFEEMTRGVRYMEKLFPRFVKHFALHRHFNCKGKAVRHKEDGCKAFKSAGLPVSVDEHGDTFVRERRPLHMIRITDESVPNKNKKYFVFPLSIHGIERAGVEGGTRAAEDLATWGACEAGVAPDVVDCESDQNAAPHPLLEATPNNSITAGKALRKSVILFMYANPDGWLRGDRFRDRLPGTHFYQRYNGNGVDLNRDSPAIGFTFRPYTPWSEPETRAFGKVLQQMGPKDKQGDPDWGKGGGIDLHGQLIDRAFSFTLIGGSERPFDKNQRVLQTVKGAWRDAEKRLAWSPIIKPNEAPGDDPRVYGVQWGTIWDTIDYTVTGALGDWIDSPLGLNGDGLDNEMSLSHLSNCGVGTCFDQDAEQLHVDGNKSLIYSMINYALKGENTTYRLGGRVGYLFNRGMIKQRTDRSVRPPRFARLDPQQDIDNVQLDGSNDFTHEFVVKGPKSNVYNGGVAASLTCMNVGGVSPCAVSEAILERKLRPNEEPDPQDEEGDDDWQTVNTYFNQSEAYVQAGQALHGNLPRPGLWRVRVEGTNPTDVFDLDINFTREKGWPDPGQLGYRVTSMKFWKMLDRFARPGLTRVTQADVLNRSGWRKLDSLVITNRVYPRLARKLKSWVARTNGNLVLLDEALKMAPEMGLIDGPPETQDVYAGYVNFAAEGKENTYDDPLARNINQPGAAEGKSCGGFAEQPCGRPNDVLHRHQTYEPVPIGYSIQDAEGDDANNSPVWYFPAAAWNDSAGRSRAVATLETTDKVIYGEIKYKGGTVRILGALLPDPTEEFDHPFGLANYAITYSGYEMLQNMLDWNS